MSVNVSDITNSIRQKIGMKEPLSRTYLKVEQTQEEIEKTILEMKENDANGKRSKSEVVTEHDLLLNNFDKNRNAKVSASEFLNIDDKKWLEVLKNVKSEVTVSIDGVDFSKDEATKILDNPFLKKSLSEYANLGNGFLFDYDSYAKIGIISSLFNSYVTSNYFEDEDSASKLESILSRYLDRRKTLNREYLENNNCKNLYVDSDIGKYYCHYLYSDSWKEKAENRIARWEKKLNTESDPKMIASLNNSIKNTKSQIEAGCYFERNSASNQSIANKRIEIFSDNDLTDPTAKEKALDQYIEELRPTISCEINGKGVDDVLRRRRESANILISDLIESMSRKPIDAFV